MKNIISKRILITFFMIYVVGGLLLLVFLEDRSFSDLEKRPLADRPTFTIEGLLNKTFASEFDAYVSDQFPFRDTFVTLKSFSERLLGRKENNGVYIGSDGYYIEKYSETDISYIDTLKDTINSLTDKYNVYTLIAPTSYSVMSENLPKFADKDFEVNLYRGLVSQLSEKIINIDTFDALKSSSDEYIYYKTDHHWTSRGAYIAYRELCAAMGIPYNDEVDFDIRSVSDDFLGTLHLKGNFAMSDKDRIDTYTFKKDYKFNINYVYSERIASDFYEYSHLATEDKYGIFMDNNHPLVKITSSCKNGRKIAIVKDSYAHSLVPLLANHFEEIHMIDLRSFRESFDEYMKNEGLDNVLLLYNIRTMLEDRNLLRINK